MTSVSTSVNNPAQQGAQVFTKTLHSVSCGMKETMAQPSAALHCYCQGSRPALFPVCIPWEIVKHPPVTSQDGRAAAHLESFTNVPIIVHHFILPRLSFGALQNTRSSARVGTALPSGCSELWFSLKKGAQRGPFHKCTLFHLLKKTSIVQEILQNCSQPSSDHHVMTIKAGSQKRGDIEARTQELDCLTNCWIWHAPTLLLPFSGRSRA